MRVTAAQTAFLSVYGAALGSFLSFWGHLGGVLFWSFSLLRRTTIVPVQLVLIGVSSLVHVLLECLLLWLTHAMVRACCPFD